VRRALVLVALVVAGCGGAVTGDGGEARLWITRDQGGRVLYAGTVPAGLTVLQALDRAADVDTRYGGRFVQSIDGIEGSLARGSDWFYFVNGVSGDRSAADYRLRDGEVAWWDYRRWSDRGEVTVVVGAFPEPFLHGYRGRRRPTHVRFERGADAGVARTLGRRVRAASVRPMSVAVPDGANELRVVARLGFSASATSAEGPYRFVVGSAEAARLAARPALARFRYRGLP
jgi:hypothetical protein